MTGKIDYKDIAPCIFAIIIDALGFGLVYPVMTAIFTTSPSPVLPADVSIHLRHFYLGLGFLLYPLFMFFGTSFMADLSDVRGRKSVLMLCMAGICISFFVMAISVIISSVTLLMLGRAFSGLMAGSQPIAQAAISDLSTPETKAKNLSVVAFSYCIGSVLGPFLGGITSDSTLISWFNFSTPFFIAAVLALIAVIWIAVAFKETYVNYSKSPMSLLRPVLIFVKAAKHTPVRNLVVIFLLMQIGFSIYFQFIIVHMKYSFNYSVWQLGAVQGMIGIGFAIGLLIGMPFALKRWQVLTIAIATGMLTGLGQLISSGVPFAELQWILAIFIALFDIMAFNAMLTLFSDAVTKDEQGWVMGIANSVMALSWTLTGLSSNLLSLLGTQILIGLGGVSLILGSSILMKQRHHHRAMSK